MHLLPRFVLPLLVLDCQSSLTVNYALHEALTHTCMRHRLDSRALKGDGMTSLMCLLTSEGCYISLHSRKNCHGCQLLLKLVCSCKPYLTDWYRFLSALYRSPPSISSVAMNRQVGCKPTPYCMQVRATTNRNLMGIVCHYSDAPLWYFS